MKNLNHLGLILASLLFISFNAQAASTPFMSEACVVTDVTVLGSASDLCAGSIDGNDSAGAMNGIFGANNSVTWFEAAKVETNGNGTGSSTNLNSTGTSGTGGTSGTLEYTGATLSSPFIVVLKASNEYSAYLFKSLAELTNGNTGTFLINFLNSGGQTSALSHITIYATNSHIPPGTIFGNPVPLPAALWLFGPALLGFMGLRKKIKS